MEKIDHHQNHFADVRKMVELALVFKQNPTIIYIKRCVNLRQIVYCLDRND